MSSDRQQTSDDWDAMTKTPHARCVHDCRRMAQWIVIFSDNPAMIQQAQAVLDRWPEVAK